MSWIYALVSSGQSGWSPRASEEVRAYKLVLLLLVRLIFPPSLSPRCKSFPGPPQVLPVNSLGLQKSKPQISRARDQCGRAWQVLLEV